MTKETGHHQPDGKKPLVYNNEGLHATEILEIALDHPFWFMVICFMIKFNVSEKCIRWFVRRIV